MQRYNGNSFNSLHDLLHTFSGSVIKTQVGEFPNWDIWAEWNGKYRDDVRRFIKGDPGDTSRKFKYREKTIVCMEKYKKPIQL